MTLTHHILDDHASEWVREMRRRFRINPSTRAEDLFSIDPALRSQPQQALDLIYEEYCLRTSAGEEQVEVDLLGRFPQFANPLRLMLDCHDRLLQSDQPDDPQIGEKIGDFVLYKSIGRGVSGRVFLARQTTLADRPVVLKIAPRDTAEHLSLARLQHTNIVPLYSVIDDPRRRIRVLCMPYFGHATMSAILSELSPVPVTDRSGQMIVDIIEKFQDLPLDPGPSPAMQMLGQMDYVQATCWIIACLADALQFADEHGLVHMDLKPSNILITSDGQPMLLDFHLAREQNQSGESFSDHFGGTPGYMPPEQLNAVRAMQSGQSPISSLDSRVDQYALGAILYESLGGKLPVRPDSPPLCRINPNVSIGLSDIVSRCLSEDRQNRYPDAQRFSDDLRRHLLDQPLVGVKTRAISERWLKWRRRKPRILSGPLVLLLLLSMGLLGAAIIHDRHQQAIFALEEARRDLDVMHHSEEAIRILEHGLEGIQAIPFQSGIRQQLLDQLSRARQNRLAQLVRGLSDDLTQPNSAPLTDREVQELSALVGNLQAQHSGSAKSSK